MVLKDSGYRPSEGEMNLSAAEVYRTDKEIVLYAQYARSKTAEDVVTNTCNAFELVDPQFLHFLGGPQGLMERLDTSRKVIKANPLLSREINYYLSEEDVLKTAVTAHGLAVTEEMIRKKIIKDAYGKQIPVHVTNGGTLFLSFEEARHMRASHSEYKKFGDYNNVPYALAHGTLPVVPTFSLAVLEASGRLPVQTGRTYGVFSDKTLLNGSYYSNLTNTIHIDTSDYKDMPHREASAKCVIDILHEGRHNSQGNMLSLVAELDAVVVTRDSALHIEETLGNIPVGVHTEMARFLLALMDARTNYINNDLEDKLTRLTKSDMHHRVNADHNIGNAKIRNIMLLRV